MQNSIKAFRKKQGITQTELANRARIARPFLSEIESGKAIPTVTKAADIARVLGTTIDELFFGSEE